MKRITDIKEVHTILLDIAKEFHNICARHNIPYYMLGGTMLGAVRHKGFIPWDDDMDFGIPRNYYKIFRKVCRTELSQYYKFIDYDNSDYAILGIGKIFDTRTELREKFSVDTDEKIGVYIDIFPLDITNSRTNIFSFNKRMRCLFKLQKLLCVNINDRTFSMKTLSRLIKWILPINKDTILKHIESSCLRRKLDNKDDMFFNIFGAWGMKELIPKKYFGKPTLYQFEDIEFYGVEDYDQYLKCLYRDYMKLPPKEKQAPTHTANITWI